MTATPGLTNEFGGPVKRIAATAFIFTLAYLAGHAALTNSLWNMILRPVVMARLETSPHAAMWLNVAVYSIVRWGICVTGALWTSSQWWALGGRWACFLPLALLYGILFLYAGRPAASEATAGAQFAAGLLMLIDLPLTCAAASLGDRWRLEAERETEA